MKKNYKAKKKKRKRDIHSSIYFQACNCIGTHHDRVHFNVFGKCENKFSPRGVCTSLLGRIVRQSGTFFDFSPDISSLKNASANSSRVTAAAINEALMHPDSCRNFIDDLQFSPPIFANSTERAIELKMSSSSNTHVSAYAYNRN